MRRALFALATLAACEKDHGARIPQVTTPHVGERDTVTSHMDGHFTGPDGQAHVGRLERAVTLETLAVRGPRVTRMRITFDRDERTIDGVTKDPLAGTFELTDTGELTKPDGTEPTPLERAYFASWHIGVDPSTLLAHEFREGEVFRPSDTERNALSLPDTESPIELHVTHATDDMVVLRGSFDEKYKQNDAQRHVEMTMRCVRGDRTMTRDATVTWEGRPVGTEHSETVIRVVQ